MNERFASTLTCMRDGCEHRLWPVEVDTVREVVTGASYLANDDDWYCECGERREEAIEGVPDQVRHRTLEAA